MAEETQYTANTGMVGMTTSNSNLDGATGTYYTVIVADNAKKGMIIKTITVKALTDTTQSMVRLFINDGAGSGSTHTKLISEIEIPAVKKSSTDPAFEITIPVDYALKADWELWASVQFPSGSPTFNVIAEGMDWDYYTSSVRPESSKYTANTGINTLTDANTSMDASGSYVYDILTAASYGTQIQSVTIKSLKSGTTSFGMIRLFLYRNTPSAANGLLTEIPVDAVTQTGTAHTFSRKIDFGGKGFFLKAGWILKATTETSDDFNVIAEGLDLTYPA